jgi:hypothetical protein
MNGLPQILAFLVFVIANVATKFSTANEREVSVSTI